MSFKITKVLLLDNVDLVAKEVLQENGIEATLSTKKFSPPDLIKELQEYDGVVVRSATKVTAEIVQACPKLKIIGRAGTGVDNIDVKAATRCGVAVMNTPGGNTISAAEHTCTLICSMSRRVPAADAHVKLGKWDRKAFMGHEIFGKVLAIIGLGRIGLEVAHRMQSFGMKTIGYDPLVSAETAKEYNIEWMELDKIWPQADYITVHTPLIPQTKGLINTKVFSLCKQGVKVVNCARGGIIDEGCLLKALDSGDCGGAGLDVFVDEPTKNMALVTHPHVVACPHLGASTKEGQVRCGKEIAQQFVDTSLGKSYFGIINAPGFSVDLPGAVATLAKGLGIIMKSYMKDVKFNLYFSISGKGLSKLGRSLKAALCSGLFNEKANLVNAGAFAEEEGIGITLENGSSDEVLLSLKGVSETKNLHLVGGVVDGNACLTGINGQMLSSKVELNGSMMIYKESLSPASKLQKIIAALSDSGLMPKIMSTAPEVHGSMWTVIVLSKAASDLGAIQSIVQELIYVQF